MDIEVNTLAQIKAETGRDLDNQVDENTLVSGEKSNGTFGVFKLFAAIKNCIDNWITTIAGAKNFTGAVTINSKAVATTEAVNNALTDYRKKTDNSNEGVTSIQANTTVKTTINVNSGFSQKIGFLLMIEGNTSDGDLTYAELYLIRCGYSGNHVTATLISSSGSKSSFFQTFGVSEDGYLTITSNIAVSYYIL